MAVNYPNNDSDSASSRMYTGPTPLKDSPLKGTANGVPINTSELTVERPNQYSSSVMNKQPARAKQWLGASTQWGKSRGYANSTSPGFEIPANPSTGWKTPADSQLKYAKGDKYFNRNDGTYNYPTLVADPQNRTGNPSGGQRGIYQSQWARGKMNQGRRQSMMMQQAARQKRLAALQARRGGMGMSNLLPQTPPIEYQPTQFQPSQPTQLQPVALENQATIAYNQPQDWSSWMNYSGVR